MSTGFKKDDTVLSPNGVVRVVSADHATLHWHTVEMLCPSASFGDVYAKVHFGMYLFPSECELVKEWDDYVIWSHLHPDFKWIARDRDDKAYAFTHKPACYHDTSDAWLSGHHVVSNPEGKCPVRIDRLLASYMKGNKAWDKSLIQRPA